MVFYYTIENIGHSNIVHTRTIENTRRTSNWGNRFIILCLNLGTKKLGILLAN